MVLDRRLVAGALGMGLMSAGTARAAAPFTATPAAPVATAVFDVAFSGSGTTATRYRAHPPNDGGADDHNRATDSGRARWSLKFVDRLTIPTCGGDPDPCSTIAPPTAATGATRFVGKINHVHVDGLYDDLDRTVRCQVRGSTRVTHRSPASLGLTYDAGAGTLGIASMNPLTDVLAKTPSACPTQGDSVDRIFDNYFTPGFSFATGYGPDRWFTSAPTAIPISTLHASSKIRIPVGLSRTGRPPRDCAVTNAYERCSTTGTWHGTITLTAVR